MKRTCPTCSQPWAYLEARAAMGSRGPVPGKAGKSTGRKPRLRRVPQQEQASQPAVVVAVTTKENAPRGGEALSHTEGVTQ